MITWEAMSPELETLDQLLGGDLSLSILIRVYPNDGAFTKAIHGLLMAGDVRLKTVEDNDVPQRRWRELFLEGTVLSDLAAFKLSITQKGVAKIG